MGYFKIGVLLLCVFCTAIAYKANKYELTKVQPRASKIIYNYPSNGKIKYEVRSKSAPVKYILYKQPKKKQKHVHEKWNTNSGEIKNITPFYYPSSIIDFPKENKMKGIKPISIEEWENMWRENNKKKQKKKGENGWKPSTYITHIEESYAQEKKKIRKPMQMEKPKKMKQPYQTTGNNNFFPPYGNNFNTFDLFKTTENTYKDFEKTNNKKKPLPSDIKPIFEEEEEEEVKEEPMHKIYGGHFIIESSKPIKTIKETKSKQQQWTPWSQGNQDISSLFSQAYANNMKKEVQKTKEPPKFDFNFNINDNNGSYKVTDDEEESEEDCEEEEEEGNVNSGSLLQGFDLSSSETLKKLNSLKQSKYNSQILQKPQQKMRKPKQIINKNQDNFFTVPDYSSL